MSAVGKFRLSGDIAGMVASLTGQVSVLTIDTDCLLNLLCQIKSGSMRSDIAGMVASLTENELDVLS